MKQVTTSIYTKFFTTGKGLSSTSANHLANLAKQTYTEDEAFLSSCSFLRQDMKVIGSDVDTTVSYGMTEEDLMSIASKLDRIAALKGFCAWCREAIAEKERYCRSVETLMPMENWAAENGITIPEQPVHKYSEPAKYNMNIAEKAEFLCEEASAATYGSFIHPSGPGYNAYKTLVEHMRNPRTVSENGRDTIIRTYTSTVSPDIVNNEFNKIRDTWRAHEARVNKQKHENETADYNTTTSDEEEYQLAWKAYDADMRNIRAQYQAYVVAERKRIQDLRIVIPNKLMAIYDELRLMGKE